MKGGTINESTKIPIRLVAAIAGAAIGYGVLWSDVRHLREDVGDIRTQLAQIQTYLRESNKVVSTQ